MLIDLSIQELLLLCFKATMYRFICRSRLHQLCQKWRCGERVLGSTPCARQKGRAQHKVAFPNREMEGLDE